MEGVSGLLRGIAGDIALRQRLLQFSNLSLGEVGVALEIQIRSLGKLLQTLHIGQLIASEIQKR